MREGVILGGFGGPTGGVAGRSAEFGAPVENPVYRVQCQNEDERG